MSSQPPLIELRGVDKSFDGQTKVLDSIDLALPRGEFLALIGPSGCGKSTLLKLIAGLIRQTDGSIKVGGGSPADAQGKLGFVFQDANLLPWMNILDNVALPLKLMGVSTEQRTEDATEMLEMVGLGPAMERYPRELSGGMRMRASIARALATGPELLLLDEPFGALDEMTRNSLNEELLRLRESQKWTGVFVTHSVSEAVFLSSKIAVLSANPGRLHDMIEVDLPFPRTARTR
ncbi:MAG: ABC transporter ATP-binding protein, partial [Halieaceae bacterium]|nr:ABC transporter ATP-binding protein [Halieaceae bacterium]